MHSRGGGQLGAETGMRGSEGHWMAETARILLFPEEDGPDSLDTPRSSIHGAPPCPFPSPTPAPAQVPPVGCLQLRLPCPWSSWAAALCPVDIRVWTRLQLTLAWPVCRCPHLAGREKLESCHLLPSGSLMGRSGPGPCFATYLWQIHLCIMFSAYLSLKWGHRGFSP